MRKVYSGQNPISVRVLEAYLNSIGLDTLVIGEDRILASGGIPPIECWVDLYVLDDQAEEVAKEAITNFLAIEASQNQQSDWGCSQCGETNPPQFTDCWNCSKSST